MSRYAILKSDKKKSNGRTNHIDTEFSGLQVSLRKMKLKKDDLLILEAEGASESELSGILEGLEKILDEDIKILCLGFKIGVRRVRSHGVTTYMIDPGKLTRADEGRFKEELRRLSRGDKEVDYFRF